MRVHTAIVVLAAIVMAGCSDEEALRAELAQMQTDFAEATKSKAVVEAELGRVKDRLIEVEAELGRVKDRLIEVEAENTALKQTPRYYFDLAVAHMQASSDNAGDERATTAFATIVNRFPHDPLAKAAGEKIAELKQRMAERARRLVKSQAEVRKLIEVCSRNTKTANEIRRGGMHFTFDGAGPLDMNRAMAASRQASGYEAKAEAAIEKAGALLRDGVPDPEGKLDDEVGRCRER